MNLILLTIVALSLAVGASGQRTCPAVLPLISTQQGFKVCLFGATDNYITDGLGLLGNGAWSLQTALYLGSCYCNQDCTPSQIVCKDPVNLGYGNITNGVAQIVYNDEAYQFYCYCPQYVSPAEACINPPNPGPCSP